MRVVWSAMGFALVAMVLLCAGCFGDSAEFAPKPRGWHSAQCTLTSGNYAQIRNDVVLHMQLPPQLDLLHKKGEGRVLRNRNTGMQIATIAPWELYRDQGRAGAFRLQGQRSKDLHRNQGGMGGALVQDFNMGSIASDENFTLRALSGGTIYTKATFTVDRFGKAWNQRENESNAQIPYSLYAKVILTCDVETMEGVGIFFDPMAISDNEMAQIAKTVWLAST